MFSWWSTKGIRNYAELYLTFNISLLLFLLSFLMIKTIEQLTGFLVNVIWEFRASFLSGKKIRNLCKKFAWDCIFIDFYKIQEKIALGKNDKTSQEANGFVKED